MISLRHNLCSPKLYQFSSTLSWTVSLQRRLPVSPKSILFVIRLARRGYCCFQFLHCCWQNFWFSILWQLVWQYSSQFRHFISSLVPFISSMCSAFVNILFFSMQRFETVPKTNIGRKFPFDLMLFVRQLIVYCKSIWGFAFRSLSLSMGKILNDGSRYFSPKPTQLWDWASKNCNYIQRNVAWWRADLEIRTVAWPNQMILRSPVLRPA